MLPRYVELSNKLWNASHKLVIGSGVDRLHHQTSYFQIQTSSSLLSISISHRSIHFYRFFIDLPSTDLGQMVYTFEIAPLGALYCWSAPLVRNIHKILAS